jgi:phosphopantetheinyl transferase (holo-ACP synthase)
MPTVNLTKNSKKKTKTSSFGDRVAKRITEQNQWQQYNSAAKFYADDIDKSLDILAEKTFSTDVASRNAYKEAILKSLTETLSPEVGVKDFWKAMAKADCTHVQIENGHLKFYKDDQAIDITPYTQPIVFEAHSSFYEQRMVERKERIEEAQKQLKDLLAEINQKRR